MYFLDYATMNSANFKTFGKSIIVVEVFVFYDGDWKAKYIIVSFISLARLFVKPVLLKLHSKHCVHFVKSEKWKIIISATVHGI